MHERTDEYIRLKAKEGKSTGELVPVAWIAETLAQSWVLSGYHGSWASIADKCLLLSQDPRSAIGEDGGALEILQRLFVSACILARDQDGLALTYELDRVFRFGALKYSRDGWRTPGIARPVRTALLAAWRHASEAHYGRTNVERLTREDGTEYILEQHHAVAAVWQLMCAAYNQQHFGGEAGVGLEGFTARGKRSSVREG